MQRELYYVTLLLVMRNRFTESRRQRCVSIGCWWHPPQAATTDRLLLDCMLFLPLLVYVVFDYLLDGNSYLASSSKR